jgi:hypothetical protein
MGWMDDDERRRNGAKACIEQYLYALRGANFAEGI